MNEEFNDARLAAIYDDLNPWGSSLEFYLSVARPDDRAILDLGCGTGMLANAFAAKGYQVVGVDLAGPMLDIARRKTHGSEINWVESRAQDFRTDQRFDLIIMTGHVFQFFLTEYDVHAVLSNIERHLSPIGRLAFESRNPGQKAWQEWTPENTATTIELESGERVEVWTAVDSVDGELVYFSMHYRFVNDRETLSSTAGLRFMDQSAAVRRLDDAGLQLVQLYGDWDASPFSSASPEMIFLAKGYA